MSKAPAVRSDKPFTIGLWILGGFYVVMVILLIAADIIFLAKPPQGRPGMISRQGGTVTLEWLHGGEDAISVTPEDGQKEVFHIIRNDKYEIIDGKEVRTQKRDAVLVDDQEKIRRGARLTMAELTGGDAFYNIFYSPRIRYALILSLLSCTVSALLSIWVAVPIGYIMARFEFPGKKLIDAILDIPIVLPPLVIGISLLALFNMAPFSWISEWVVFEVPAIILAQFMVASAFAVRTLRVTFERIPERFENVALTLGCNRAQAFFMVILPQARYGIITALTLAWARALGEFGPILVFAGSTEFRTEVLPTSVFLELQSGSLKGTLVISLIMIFIATVVLIAARFLGMRQELES